MHIHFHRPLAIACGVLLLNVSATVQAGAPAPAFKSGKEVEMRPEEPFSGSFTVGGRFSEHFTDGYVDVLQPVWQTPNGMLALSARATHADSDQNVYSFGAVWRYLVPEREVIFGVNAFYDYIESDYGNHFDQLGLGAEILSRWFDARINYYLPDDSKYVIATRTRTRTDTSTSTRLIPAGQPVPGAPLVGPAIVREETTVRTTEQQHRYEVGLEGFYTEAGFLMPGLDRYLELRLFGGYYHFNNPFGSDFHGFQGRAEARVLPGLIADATYYEDDRFAGSHWVFGVRASVPFDFSNLFRGRNPFEGAGESFRPGRQDFTRRMGEMVYRSPRIKTVISNFREEDSKQSTEVKTLSALPTGDNGPPEFPEFPDGVIIPEGFLPQEFTEVIE